jgi:hypothetical protein
VNTAAAVALNTINFCNFTAGISANVIRTPNQEIPLLPGMALQLVVANTSNQELRVGYIWRERFLEPAERA